MTEQDALRHTSRIRKAVNAGKYAALLENQVGNRPWEGYWNSDLLDYQRTFRRLIDRPFSQQLAERRKAGKGAYVLDLMSQGTILHQLPLEGGLAVSLGDGRTPEVKDIDAKNNIDLVMGNILLRKPWHDVDEWLERKGINGFDLVLCRPEGGLYSSYIPSVAGLYYTLLENTWKILSPNEGHLYTQVPRFFHRGDAAISKETMTEWLSEVGRSGIGVEYDYECALKLVKYPDSPPKLPVV